jgi:hypothetical protein
MSYSDRRLARDGFLNRREHARLDPSHSPKTPGFELGEHLFLGM